MPDHKIPSRYLEANFEAYERIAVLLNDRQHPELTEHKILRVEQVSGDKYMGYLRAMNAQGKDISVSMNPLKADALGRRKTDIAQIRHVYLDLDEGGRQALDAILRAKDMPAPHHVLETSPERYQIIWQVREFQQEQAEQLMKGMAERFGADMAATDSTRMLRLPGFRNHKYPEIEHYVADIGKQSPGRTWTPEDFPRFEPRDLAMDRSYEGARTQPRGDGPDQSREDWKFAMRGWERGVPASVMEAELIKTRREIAPGKHPDLPRYARLTVEKARQRWVSKGSPRYSRHMDR